jgi:Putative bacterial sensory transduction regulator
MRSTLTGGLAAGLALALFAAPARAQDEHPVYKRITLAQMEQVLRELKLEFEPLPVRPAGDVPPGWRVMIAGYKVLLLSGGRDLQLIAVFSDRLSPERVNEWNRTSRFGRVYLAQDGKTVCVHADLDFAGGVTIGQIKKFLTVFRQNLKEFVRFLDADR